MHQRRALIFYLQVRYWLQLVFLFFQSLFKGELRSKNQLTLVDACSSAAPVGCSASDFGFKHLHDCENDFQYLQARTSSNLRRQLGLYIGCRNGFNNILAIRPVSNLCLKICTGGGLAKLTGESESPGATLATYGYVAQQLEVPYEQSQRPPPPRLCGPYDQQLHSHGLRSGTQ